MRYTLLLLPLLLAGCGGEGDAAQAAAEPDSVAAAAPEGRPAAPPAEDGTLDLALGTATVTFRGPGTNISGEYPATRCGGPYFIPDQKGVTYETRFEGHTLLVGDTERREPGPQDPDGASWHFVINGPNRTFGRTEGQPLTASFGPGLKSAEVRGTVSPIFTRDDYQVEVKFTCR
jgi:hypothetical protein